MTFEPNSVYHIFNQGNNKQTIFFSDANYRFFQEKMKKHLLPYVDLLAYCLMPNHFHFLVCLKKEGCELSHAVKPRRKVFNNRNDHFFYQENSNEDFQQNLSFGLCVLLRSYTRAINVQEGRTGSLFRKNTKVKDGFLDGFVSLDSVHDSLFFSDSLSYVQVCFNYIHQNPVKAGLVDEALDWKYSSYCEYFMEQKTKLCNELRARDFYLI